jgi:hypothetical protein
MTPHCGHHGDAHAAIIPCHPLADLPAALQDLLVEELEQQQGKEMVRSLLALERDRLRWLLKSYLRTRLIKVERFAGARCSDRLRFKGIDHSLWPTRFACHIAWPACQIAWLACRL